VWGNTGGRDACGLCDPHKGRECVPPPRVVIAPKAPAPPPPSEQTATRPVLVTIPVGPIPEGELPLAPLTTLVARSLPMTLGGCRLPPLRPRRRCHRRHARCAARGQITCDRCLRREGHSTSRLNTYIYTHIYKNNIYWYICI